MKKMVVIISITALVFLGLSSGAYCQRLSGGGSPGGGYRGGGYYGGGYYGGGYRGGGYYGRGYYGRGGYYYGGGPYFFFGWPFVFPYYTNPYGYYPYSYPYSYPYTYEYPYQNYPSAYAESPVYVEPEQPYSWYYCQDAQAYYPYVTSCPGGWTRVVPTPPGEEGVTK
jgi:hypothetical protein